MVPTLVSVLNRSTNLSDAEVARATLAIGKQLAEAAQVHGAMPAIEFVPAGGTPEGIPCEIADTIDVPGAEGYHDEGPDGVPYIKLLSDAGWTVTLSHELLELGGDPAANRWAMGPDGNLYAWELCDADQGGTYLLDGIEVSNYLYPGFFDPNAQAGERLDRQGNITKPFMTNHDGYQIVWIADPQKITQVFAHARHPRLHHVKAGVFVAFGENFPAHKRQAKIRKADRRRIGPKAAAPFVLGMGG